MENDKDTKIQNWAWFILGVICAIVAITLVCQLLSAGGFWAWLWKLPTSIVAVMAAVVFIDVGVNGDRPPR